MESKKGAEGLWYVDVEYQGAEHLIATGVMETDTGLVLVDPGPTASLDGLKASLEARGASLADVHALLLTHIHLDHAGATGTIVREQPSIQVYVHTIGAPHVADPSRLLKSAGRLYGDEMDVLWGDVLPISEGNIHAVSGDETLEIGGRSLRVAYTPGHAKHHVSFLDEATGMAFIGDVGGQRTTGVDYVVPVTPPPDVDLEAWQQSFDAIRDWQPERLFLTHFGPSEDVDEHLDEMYRRLTAWAGEVRSSLDARPDFPSGDAEQAVAFAREKQAEMRDIVPEAHQFPYERFGEPAASWHGLARYWRKKGVGVREHG